MMLGALKAPAPSLGLISPLAIMSRMHDAPQNSSSFRSPSRARATALRTPFSLALGRPIALGNFVRANSVKSTTRAGGARASTNHSGTSASAPSCSTSYPQAGHQIMYPPRPRVSTPRQILLALFLKSGCGLNKRWRPPERVTCLRVIGRLVSWYHCCASGCWKSRTSTTNFSPVGTPIRASGNCRHQLRIISGSVDASLKPRAVYGVLLSWQGKTGMLSAANLTAWVLITPPPVAFLRDTIGEYPEPAGHSVHARSALA